MRLSIKKNGKGYVTSYTINLGTAEARHAGFVDENGTLLELKKEIDPENNTITIKLKNQEPDL